MLLLADVEGLTDELRAWQTGRLLDLERSRSAGTVRVRPEPVVEVAIDGVQRSTRYPGGVALRSARVRRYRPDKGPDRAGTVDTVRALLPADQDPERRSGDGDRRGGQAGHPPGSAPIDPEVPQS